MLTRYCEFYSKIYLIIIIAFLTTSCSSTVFFASTKCCQQPINKKFVEEGIASYYAYEFAGRTTASGEVYNPNELTAAHRTLPFGTKLKVTNLKNGKVVIVKVNDRGPFVEGRILDLSKEAARKLDFFNEGLATVRIEIVE